MKRSCQASFYTLSKRVRNASSRRKKAGKILQALTRHAGRSLSSAVCLDVGCSSGMITATLAPFLGTMLGLEYDDIALRAVDQKARMQVQFIQGDAMNLPFRDSAIDIIICAQVYEHVPDDERLLEEIHRVLSPGGVVFFSGPNWLFPIEPHYFLPFLHWLPEPLANVYLQLSRQGTHYYERSRSIWGLRRIISKRFIIRDITLEVLRENYLPKNRTLGRIFQCLLTVLWKPLLPFSPNFNWILYKPSRQ